jgi:hypothetical protein
MVSGTYRSRPPFGVLTWPFQSDRWTQDLPFAEIDISTRARSFRHTEGPLPQSRSTMRCAVASSELADETRDHRSHASGATQLRGHGGQVKQGEQESFMRETA